MIMASRIGLIQDDACFCCHPGERTPIPIPLREFEDHVEKMKENDSMLFAVEYEVMHFVLAMVEFTSRFQCSMFIAPGEIRQRLA